MSPEEVIGKFMSFELMIKGSKQIVNLEQGGTSTPDVQPVAFKATEEKKEESTSSRLPIDASKLDNGEMTLIIKSFRQILKQRRGKDYKPRSKRVCYKCGKPDHFIAKCPISSDSDRGDDKRGKKKEKKRYYKKKGSDAHVCREWDSDMSSTDSSSNEDAANITVNKGLLFPNVGHKCFMAKDGKKKKVQTRTTPKYTTSSDEGSSSDDEDNLLSLFANINMEQKEKLNELIGVFHEKDELLDSQEEFLIKENKKHVKVKNAYAQEIEKCENLTRELSICHDTISNLRTENSNLFAKVEKLNVCDDSIVSLRKENASLIAKLDKLNESISSLRTENDNLISKAKDLNVCNDSISNLRNGNAMLHAKIDELNACKPSTSSVDHVTICT
jgi:ubiquinone biosynthesis protein UbiJ